MREEAQVGAAALSYCEGKIEAFDGKTSLGDEKSSSGFLTAPQWTLVKTVFVLSVDATAIELRVMTNSGLDGGPPPCMLVDDIEVRYTPNP